ncbi:MAG: hypothetical protein ACKO2N_05750, partial [Tabrizicola sp.]
MKPSFALNFTDDSIQLLHRTGKGWVPVGETPFATDNLVEALAFMRKTALGLEPGGFTTKLIIPNSQIRYVEVDAPASDEDARRAQIAAALENQTPLRADEMAFDWSGKGKTVKVAAVARETLDEAESFASAHRFNPVSFVAVPDYGDFSGEPWFGTTTNAATLLNGETVERDKNPLRILLRDVPLPFDAAGDVAAAPDVPTTSTEDLPAPEKPDMSAAPAPSSAAESGVSVLEAAMAKTKGEVMEPPAPPGAEVVDAVEPVAETAPDQPAEAQ